MGRPAGALSTCTVCGHAGHNAKTCKLRTPQRPKRGAATEGRDAR
jgi:hypothetical protein